MILTTDKGVSLVVMNKEEYVKKAEELLNTNTYRTISNDPTNKYKNKLINLLKTIKAEGGISDAVYKRHYPTGAGTPKFYGLPKIHKEGMPLRPIVSSIGAASYETSNELARILKPLMGKSPYQVQNSKDFIQQIQGIKLYHQEIVRRWWWTPTKNQHVSQPYHQPSGVLLEKYLFHLPARLYEQQEGAAMGSPISPIVANLFMKDFEKKTIDSSPHPPVSGEDL